MQNLSRITDRNKNAQNNSLNCVYRPIPIPEYKNIRNYIYDSVNNSTFYIKITSLSKVPMTDTGYKT